MKKKWSDTCYKIMYELEKKENYEKSLKLINAIKFACPIYDKLESLVKDKYDNYDKYRQINLF